jgi:hypothetical protein
VREGLTIPAVTYHAVRALRIMDNSLYRAALTLQWMLHTDVPDLGECGRIGR